MSQTPLEIENPTLKQGPVDHMIFSLPQSEYDMKGEMAVRAHRVYGERSPRTYDLSLALRLHSIHVLDATS